MAKHKHYKTPEGHIPAPEWAKKNNLPSSYAVHYAHRGVIEHIWLGNPNSTHRALFVKADAPAPPRNIRGKYNTGLN